MEGTMKILNKEGYEFINYSNSNAEFVFSTAKNNLNLSKNSKEGINNLENLKEWFELKEVGYLNQTHSDYIYVYDGKIHEGDAIITEEKNIAVGIFTADCVPILMYDKTNNVIAAVHSGWKGTEMGIASKTIDKLIKNYGAKAEDLVVCIGPHIGGCCYEVSEELIELFKNNSMYKDIDFHDGRKLNLKKCIIHQLKYKGVLEDNIHDVNICTFCNKEYETYSYRRNDKESRLFSFIFLK